MSLDAVDVSNRAKVWTSVSTEIGRKYTLVFTTTASSSHFNIGTTAGGYQIKANSNISAGTYSNTFTATTTTTYLYHETWVTGGVLDNVSVRIAEEDRSVNDNGLQVFGTITKDPVATGADLVAYSGFSASNYLEQPYNSDLDFGTGDFCLMGWFNVSTTANQIWVMRSPAGTLGNTQFGIYSSSGRVFYYCGSSSASSANGTVEYNGTGWHQVAMVRVSGVAYIYIDGQLTSSLARAGTVTEATSKIRVGLDAADLRPATNSSLALWRISATAPSAEQIAKIYEDEKFLFQENAQATLYGSSDAVTALAYDDDTELLHVGTSAGRSVFQGLRRIDNTTDAVGAAISASNGMVAED